MRRVVAYRVRSGRDVATLWVRPSADGAHVEEVLKHADRMVARTGREADVFACGWTADGRIIDEERAGIRVLPS